MDAQVILEVLEAQGLVDRAMEAQCWSLAGSMNAQGWSLAWMLINNVYGCLGDVNKKNWLKKKGCQEKK